MTLNITHTFINPIADDPTFPGTKPSDWNAAHTISGTLPAANIMGTVNQVEYGNTDGTITSSSNFTYDGNNLAVGSSVPVYTSPLNFQQDSLGAVAPTKAQSLTIQNTAAAVLGIQQYTPGLTLMGNGWGTTAGTSQNITWQQYASITQSTVPISTLNFGFSVAGGAFTTPMSLTSAGTLTCPQFFSNGAATAAAFQSTAAATTANFVALTTSSNTTTLAQLLFAGAATVNYRMFMRGSVTAVMGIGNSYGAFIIGNMPMTGAASGVHALLAQQVIKAVTFTPGASSTVTNTANLYLESAATVTVTGVNYTLWCGTGVNRFDGAIVNTPSANPSLSGASWNDSTQICPMSNINGNTIYNTGATFIQTADKTIANTTTPTSIFGTGIGSLALTANTLTAGKTIKFDIQGIESTVAVTAPNLVVTVKLGSATLATTTITNLPAGASGLAFQISGTITVRTTGASGTCVINGKMEYETALLGAPDKADLNNGGATVTIDTTASNTLDVTWAWSAASASNTVKSTTSIVELIA